MVSGNTYIDPINLPPPPPGKSEIDVAADYLFHLRQAMRNQLQKTLGEVFNREERNIRYFLTVPAIWNDAGKAATRRAPNLDLGRKGGDPPGPHPGRLPPGRERQPPVPDPRARGGRHGLGDQA